MRPTDTRDPEKIRPHKSRTTVLRPSPIHKLPAPPRDCKPSRSKPGDSNTERNSRSRAVRRSSSRDKLQTGTRHDSSKGASKSTRPPHPHTPPPHIHPPPPS